MTPALISSLGLCRIAAARPPVHVADPGANAAALIAVADGLVATNADVILTPELSLTGYTIGDLVRNEDLLRSARQALRSIAEWTASHGCLVVVGLPMTVGAQIYNVAAVVQGGAVRALVPKTYLPSSHEFYEHRWYASGSDALLHGIRSVHLDGMDVPFGIDLLLSDEDHSDCVIGIEICEDLWAAEPPSGALAAAGATLILNLSASNELVGKAAYRRQLVQGQSARTLTAYAYASSGPTESVTDTVFSGHCMIAERGTMLAESERLVIDGTTVVTDVDLRQCVRDRRANGSFASARMGSVRRIPVRLAPSLKASLLRTISPLPFIPSDTAQREERCREILQLQGTALAMRWRHTGSERLVLGLSGGLDSTLALLACMQACEILGRPASRILAVSMPGPGTTERTRRNAEEFARSVGCEFRQIPIHDAVQQHFLDIGHDPSDHSVVFENAQARERTQILMDVANSVSGIVVGTGDMSELALGWCTYNADQMSMYGVNAGVPKTLVRHVIEWYASHTEDVAIRTVLADILETPISPELLPPSTSGEIQQRTEDHLGPYEVHDFFLYHVIRLEQPIRTVAIEAMLAFAGRYSAEQILEWCEVFVRRFFSQQFKRSAMPDGVKIGSVVLSPRADWRMPSDASPSAWLHELSRLRTDVGGHS